MRPSSRIILLALACSTLTRCRSPYKSEGEKLAHTYCSVCHAFPDPQLLDKKTWQASVLPQMATRLGAGERSLFAQTSRNPYMPVLTKAVSAEQWAQIVAFYAAQAPDSLPAQSLPAEPRLDPGFFHTGAFVPRLESSGIITLLEADSLGRRIFVGEAATNRLRVFDWNRRLVATLALKSPPTDVIPEAGNILVLESGILEPNDEPRGTLAQYDVGADGQLRFSKVLIDSLLRPVFVRGFDFDGDGRDEYVICEFGDNRGRLALYRYDGAKYQRQVLDATPGAIRFELHDLTGDGQPDIVALFGQGDERIVLYANDGKGHFASGGRLLARFPPVYGSMYFTMRDFNGDGKLAILYVNGDNFDFSRVLKPYHGIRILENDGRNNFVERYFFPIYGAAQAAVADFDKDGDLDILAASNFSDPKQHPERGIMYFENAGGYTFRPYAFSVASKSQWNLMASADLDGDGWLDVIIGSMRLENITRLQRRFGAPSEPGIDPILVFENKMAVH
jgi:cytochrome c553